MISGVTVKGFVAVLLLTVGAFGVVGGMGVVLLGMIEAKFDLVAWGVATIIIGAISGYAGSWLYDEESMDEEI